MTEQAIDKVKLANWIRGLVAHEIDRAKKEIMAEIKAAKTPRPRKPRADGFEDVWKLLQRGGRDEAEKAYIKAVQNGATKEQLMASIQAHHKFEWNGRSKDKIPHLSTFLNRGYYKTNVTLKPVKIAPVVPTCKCGRILNSGERQSGICLACEYKAKLENERTGQ